jgi:hypothetical protein
MVLASTIPTCSLLLAFAHIGENTTAHNLALGFALCWITPLVVASVVDRNPTAIKDLKGKFNRLLRDVRLAMQSPEAQQALSNEIGAGPDNLINSAGIEAMASLPDEFFIDFAGQGRLRWHTGVAHPILAGIERSFAAEYGRGWLSQEMHAIRALLLVHGKKGFRIFDLHLIWQCAAAFLIVYGNLAAGIIISYYTPTVGLSCRSGGYTLFAILTFVAAMGEAGLEILSIYHQAARRIASFALTFLEFCNVCWLIFITLAQTFGLYQTCWCLSSADIRGEQGYIQFDSFGQDTLNIVSVAWSLGTGLAGGILTTSLGYIVWQWCEQSHMMSTDYAKASTGLKWTRNFKRARAWLLFAPRMLVIVVCRFFHSLTRRKARPHTRMLWAVHSRKEYFDHAVEKGMSVS